MGFFQDLKADISQAVDGMLPEEQLSEEMQQELEDDTAVEEAMKEVEKALAEEFEQQEEPMAVEEVTEEPEEEAEPEEEPVEEPEEEKKEETAQPTVEPVIDAAAAQIASIANIVAKEEAGGEDYEEREMQTPEELLANEDKTEKEETELEKEVEKAMAEQKMSLADEEVVDETAIITKGMEITGDMISRGSIDILGKVRGNVEVLGKLNVSGTVEGDSKAAEVFSDSAHITGKIVADGTVKIGIDSVIIGDISASSAVIAGAVKGDIDVQGPVILDATAVVMGNIKSKSVQINNGAVIEGMCSQCYADVNPIAYFDDLIKK